jgi:hypothetical protein
VCHRTLSGALGSYESELATFGFQKSCFAIIHRTVKCTSGATTVAQWSTATDTYKSATVRAESEQPPEGAPDSEQYMSGAAPNCPVPHEDKAPMVETVRTLTVG